MTLYAIVFDGILVHFNGYYVFNMLLKSYQRQLFFNKESYVSIDSDGKQHKPLEARPRSQSTT